MSLKNHEYNKILRDYDAKQYKSRHDMEQRKALVYQEIPKLKELDDELVTNSIQAAKHAVLGNDAGLKQLEKENTDIRMHKTELLLQHGYSDDYLLPRYDCEDCKDTGYIGTQKCHCFKQAIADLIYTQSNIKGVLEFENFKTFNLDYYSTDFVDPILKITPRANMERILKVVRAYIDNFETSYSNLYLYGTPGVGKTFLTNCIAKEILDKGLTTIYLTSFQLFDILEKETFNKNDDSNLPNIKLDYILDCDLLIIDDLGTELSNSFTNTKLFLCINERHLREKSTIISTNIPIDSIKVKYSERIYSRITSEYLCLKLFGDDIRVKKRFF